MRGQSIPLLKNCNLQGPNNLGLLPFLPPEFKEWKGLNGWVWCIFSLGTKLINLVGLKNHIRWYLNQKMGSEHKLHCLSTQEFERNMSPEKTIWRNTSTLLPFFSSAHVSWHSKMQTVTYKDNSDPNSSVKRNKLSQSISTWMEN